MRASTDPVVGMTTTVLNAARWFDEMLESVRGQTYASWRLVIVDDGSDDGSVEIAQRHAAADARITVMSNPAPRGWVPAARAYGRRQVEGARYLFFPDADDVLEPDALARLVVLLERRRDAVAAFCRFRRIDEHGRLLGDPPPPRIVLTKRWSRALRDSEEETPFESIYGWAAPAMEPVIMLRADAYDRVGGWRDAPMMGGESVDLLCRMLADGSVVFEPAPLYRYRLHVSQHSRDQERHAVAAAAIRAAWRERAQHDLEVRPRVEAAEFFIDHRLIPRSGLAASWARARRGDLVGAARFTLGAIRRYRWRIPPIAD